MADNKRKRGKADRRKVAGKQPYEVSYVARKFGVSAAIVRKIVKFFGNKRTTVYAAVRRRKRRRRAA